MHSDPWPSGPNYHGFVSPWYATRIAQSPSSTTRTPRCRDPANAPVAVGIDGPPASALATAMAFDEAARRGVDLIAVHVWGDYTDDLVNGTWDSLGDWADEALRERLAGWTERYPDVTVYRVVEQNRPARSLLERAKKAQLLVVGRHGRGGCAGLVLGSVSSAIDRSAGRCRLARNQGPRGR
jgi:nucleotide-binding universal stress UspA family protein